ncbi:hypothetical protein Salat_2900100 [Sesamum alatum]|uniref:Uncharacterized protein n=1 Tax=Sesamum alatum TaxID=300844 RepID=A0AAE1XIE2_9LAMI|nr:hypothetical protein Salat_2900100 [Sesamum alatum]
MRAAGPIRSLRQPSVTVRPTYVWRSPSVAGSAGSNRQGVHSFGDFWREMDDTRRHHTMEDGHVAASTSFPERLNSHPWKLDTWRGQAKAVSKKQLLDEDSESIRLGLQGEKFFGLSQDVDKASPCHLARSDSVGSSLGLVEVQPIPLVSRTGVHRLTSLSDGFLDAIVAAQWPEVSLSRRERQSVEERSSIDSFHRGGASLLQPIRALGKDCSSGGIPESSPIAALVDVPLSESISPGPLDVGTRATGFRGRGAHLRGRGR